MAITPTITTAGYEPYVKPRRVADRTESRVLLSLSGTYVTGGFDLSAYKTQAGLDNLKDVKEVLLTDGTNYITGYYDNANNKLKLVSPGGVYSAAIGSPAVGSTTAVHAAHTDDGAEEVLTTGITNPDVPRNITATAGGTAGDIKAITVTIDGTNYADEVIQEVLPAFTVNTPGTVTGSQAFKTVTQITIPAHDGTGATTAIGTGAKLGLHHELSRDTVLRAFFGGVLEGTAPTIAFDADEYDKNTATLNSTLDGSAVIVDYYTDEGQGFEMPNGATLTGYSGLVTLVD